MAVQQLAKDQAKREKKSQKDLDDKFAKDEEKNLKDIEDTMRLMEERRKGSKDFIEMKRGGQVKCGVQMKGTSPLIRR
jgi:hypothetical protein